MSRRDIQQLANQHPTAANAFLTLHRAYETMREAARSGDQISQQSKAPRPLDAVRRVLEAQANYFPDLEEAAERFGRFATGRSGKLVSIRVKASFINRLARAKIWGEYKGDAAIGDGVCIAGI